MELTHWKKAFKSDYLSSSDVDGKDLIKTIAYVKCVECKTRSGIELHNLAYFTDTKLDHKGKCIGGTKPMILNVGNSKIVKKFAGNKIHLDYWVNIDVSIYVDQSVRFGNDTVEGLRIRPQAPRKDPKLPPLDDSKIDDAVLFIQQGKSIAELKTHYAITAKQEEIIKTKLDEANL